MSQGDFLKASFGHLHWTKRAAPAVQWTGELPLGSISTEAYRKLAALFRDWTTRVAFITNNKKKKKIGFQGFLFVLSPKEIYDIWQFLNWVPLKFTSLCILWRMIELSRSGFHWSVWSWLELLEEELGVRRICLRDWIIPPNRTSSKWTGVLTIWYRTTVQTSESSTQKPCYGSW